MSRRLSTLFVALILFAVPAKAELPEPITKLIERAIATGDPAKVKVVIDLARAQYPEEKAAIDALNKPFQTQLREQREAAAAAAQAELEASSPFDLWKGRGEVGGFRSTGKRNAIGLSAGLKLAREGIDWRHKIAARADYQRSNDVTTREQYSALYEPNYLIDEKLYAFGLGQVEVDRLQGFASRLSVASGLGYQLFEGKPLELFVKAGPAFRRTDFVDEPVQERIAGLAALDLAWAVSDRLSLTQVADAYVQQGNSTFHSTSGIEARIDENLLGRISYAVEHETDPPRSAVKTDTLTRVTIIYDF